MNTQTFSLMAVLMLIPLGARAAEPMDHSAMDHGTMSHDAPPQTAAPMEPMDHSKMNHDTMDHGQMDHGTMNHEQMDHSAMHHDMAPSSAAHEVVILPMLKEAPPSGKSRESGFDGDDMMAATGIELPVQQQCALASRGFVMLDRAAWAQCTGQAAPQSPPAPAAQHQHQH